MKIRALLVSGFLLTLALDAGATTITYTSSAAFFAALAGGSVTIETYQGLPANSTIADGTTVNGITYDSFPAGTDGRVDKPLDSDGNQLLALVRPGGVGGDFFFPGEGMTVTFPFAVNAVGILFNVGISPVNSLQVLTAVGNAGNPVAYDQPFYYFVGLISDSATFNSATFRGLDTITTRFRLDNLSFGNAVAAAAVPEPTTLLLFGAGVLVLIRSRRKKQ
jgi:PEP-CTERM motif